jgi:hypothetical protein
LLLNFQFYHGLYCVFMSFYFLDLFYFCKLSLLEIQSNFLNFQNNAAMHIGVQMSLLYLNICSFE